MDQPRSAKPADVSRPARRSLAEFALPAAGMVEELPAEAVLPPPTQLSAQPSTVIEHESQLIHAPLNQDHGTAANGPACANAPKAADVEDDELLHQFGDLTSAATTAAKDYRYLMLEHMKINMTAALNYMNGIAAVNSRITSSAHPDAAERASNRHSQSAEQAAPVEGKVADEYRVKAFGLMTDNISTTLEYAQRLARVKTLSEFVELTTSQARKQFELSVQARELGSIAQRLAPRDITSLTGSFAKLFSEREE